MFTKKELWDFFHLDKFWIYVNEYRGGPPGGDLDYSRIVIHGGGYKGWIYSRRLSKKIDVKGVLGRIMVPVSKS